ncbi:MAG: cell filamentation protein Fic [Spirochaetia bacterium]|nr:cell filamentation protein Fic [Spirochaetia bacterium]
MKKSRMQRCIDYIRFNHESEGFSLSDEDEADIIAVLEKDETADSLIEKYILEKSLVTSDYIASDKDFTFYPNTRCLFNFFDLKNSNKLREVSIYITSLRTAEMMVNPLDGAFDLDRLIAIHSNLFSDIYPSAGTLRTKAAAKRTEFCRPAFIKSSSKEIFSKLSKDHYLRGLDRETFISDLAYYMGEVEAIHPFRNGNAPAVRLFFWDLIDYAGYQIDWASADPDRLLEADICAIDGDFQPLIDVLEEIVYLK